MKLDISSSSRHGSVSEGPRADDVVYNCNFDQGDCGFIIDEPSKTHMSFQKQVDVGSYVYTDASFLCKIDALKKLFTKLTGLTEFCLTDKPSSNGKSCQIPFTSNNNEYYKCTENDECETGGELAKCPAGGELKMNLMKSV